MAQKFISENGVEVLVQSLTFGYLEDIENNIVEDNLKGAVLDATDLNEDSLRSFTRTDVNAIFEIVKRQTYPELYDKNGNLLDSDDVENSEEDKKKD